jgi:hypothetical protein
MEQQQSSSLGESPDILRLAGILAKMINLQRGKLEAQDGYHPDTRALLRSFAAEFFEQH